MKTVQECLKELDIEELIDEYLDRDYIRREMIKVMKKKDMTTKELLVRYREAIGEYIEYMRNIPVEHLEEQGLLYVYQTLPGLIRDDYWHDLVIIPELREKCVDAEDYSYILCSRGEIAGFLVADTKLTQEHLLTLMADVLYEASFFGYTQEDIDDYLKEGEETSNELEDDEALEDWMPGSPAYKRREPEARSEEELRLEKIYNQAKYKYAEYLRNKARLEVVKTLC